MSRRRRRPAQQVSPRPLPQVVGPDVRDIIRDELTKALALPAGATATSVSAAYLQSLQRTGNPRVSGAAALSRDPYNNTSFGPGEPLYPAPIDPLLPSGRAAPRRNEFDVSWNLQTTTTRSVPWSVLRDAADQVSVMRSCIEVNKSAITGLEWSFEIDPSRAKHLAKRSGDSPHTVTSDLQDTHADDMDRLHQWWAKPDRINNWTFSEWLGALLEDQLVLDAVSIYPHLTLGGGLHSLELLDSSTIKPLLDHRGATPQPPFAAFQQILWGFPRGEYAQSPPEHVDASFVSAIYGRTSGVEAGTDALIYKVRNRRTRGPYGFSNVEQALADIDLWLKRFDWLRSEYTAGVTPQMIVGVDSNMTPEQLRSYEAVFNDDLSGRTAERHRARFLPAGFNAEYPQSHDAKFTSDFDLHLIRLICAAFDVLPTSIGFSPNHGSGNMGGQGHSQGEQDCYNKNVEVLTRAGWKKFEDVDISVDEFATRNPKTRAFEWQEATHKTVADYDGEMIRFHNSRTLDITVSPNHRMLLKNTGRHDTEFIARADEAAGRPCLIPVLSTWDAPDVERFELAASGITNSKSISCSGDDYAAFMGMYLAEGCPLPYGVQIAQREKSKGFAEFRDLVERMTGYPPKHHAGRSLRIFSSVLRDHCAPLGKSNQKYVPDLIKNMSKRQLEIFMHYYWLGDGWAGTNGQPRMATASKRLADDLQEIAQKIGYGAGITTRPAKPGRHQMYHLGLRRAKSSRYDVERVPYKGKIYCVTVPNEVLYVRENGQPLWCGNSQLQRGTKPTAQWIIDLVNEVSTNYLGMPPEVTFRFHGLDREDEQKEATLLTGYVNTGLQTINEGRDQRGLPRFPFLQANEPFLATPTGPAFLNPAVEPVGLPGNLPSAPQNHDGYQGKPPATPEPPAKDDQPDAKRGEQKAFMTFLRKRAGGAWRDFTFTAHSPSVAEAANRLAAAGDVDAVKCLFAMNDG